VFESSTVPVAVSCDTPVAPTVSVTSLPTAVPVIPAPEKSIITVDKLFP